jgi:hypothetical protein
MPNSSIIQKVYQSKVRTVLADAIRVSQDSYKEMRLQNETAFQASSMCSGEHLKELGQRAQDQAPEDDDAFRGLRVLGS